jgi:DNA-binding transcriptional LysR family regulator
MPEVDDLRAFVEVVETGGFSRAALRLGLAKSIVSRRIARLEADLGAPLLARTTRGVTPTEAGAEFKVRAEQILADLDAASAAVAAHGGEIVGRLRVAAPLSFGLRHLAPLFAELAARHPRLEVEVSYSDSFVDIVAERFDAAVRLGQLADSSLIARRIAPIHGAICATPAYFEVHGRPRRPDDLLQHECLVQNTGRATAVWRFQDGKRWRSINPRGRFRADNGEAVLQAALAGLGVAYLPTFLIGEAIETGALEPVLRDYPLPEAGLYLVRPPGGQATGKVRALGELLQEKLGGEPWWDHCVMARLRPSSG